MLRSATRIYIYFLFRRLHASSMALIQEAQAFFYCFTLLQREQLKCSFLHLFGIQLIFSQNTLNI